MPYIDKKRREELNGSIDHNNVVIAGERPETPGELNYTITELILEYLPKDPKYTDYNTVVGVLEACKLEFYRRAVAPYENQKAFDNGDVYGEWIR